MIDPNKMANLIGSELKKAEKRGLIKLGSNKSTPMRRKNFQGGGVAVPRARRNQVSLMKPLDTTDESLTKL